MSNLWLSYENWTKNNVCAQHLCLYFKMYELELCGLTITLFVTVYNIKIKNKFLYTFFNLNFGILVNL